ncbi:MAG: hypothetical protein A2665_02885 [Candidatus Zambryskibacteria bacterium RIFCSPHIGHO2_01_FULL_46_30]|uniref:Uncharacterized protein n=1 Tax=Candidatus Zambryskibacteria bacterium RIFCSPHIGHO2_01_FULL_46_30 TaxID=1802739 RepID=A0A1G2T1L4_9BACT|nr:MAG: hypothetical protein A2665_02885 [Candidatus Zambryskibacteria bacterium RIFCSPHIGHO2_01_FULL_46_30]
MKSLKIKESLKKVWADNPIVRKTTGVVLVIIGLISIITPLTPVGFLLLLGLEILGIRILVWDKLKSWFKK